MKNKDWVKQLERDRFIYKWQKRLGYVVFGILVFFASKGIGDAQQDFFQRLIFNKLTLTQQRVSVNEGRIAALFEREEEARIVINGLAYDRTRGRFREVLPPIETVCGYDCHAQGGR